MALEMQKDRVLAVLVGAVRRHEIGILARLVLQPQVEEGFIVFSIGFFPSLVFLFKPCEILLPQFVKVLSTVPAEQFVENAAVCLGTGSLHIVTIKFQIPVSKI